MPSFIHAISLLTFLVCLCVSAPAVHAQEPGWTAKVVKRGQDRQVTQNTEILNRPYRPFHFYGNTVRRLHYQGKALPGRNDLQMTVKMLRRRSSPPAYSSNR